MPFRLPVDVRSVLVRPADRIAGAGISQVEIAPTSLVAASAREDTPVHAIESIEGHQGGYIVYVDGNAYPERGVFWTRAEAEAHIRVMPGDARRIVLILNLGPRSGRVRLTIGGEERLVDVGANTVVRLPLDVPPNAGLVPISVQSPVSFRPSETDPASNDTRRLGCQVRVQLE